MKKNPDLTASVPLKRPALLRHWKPQHISKPHVDPKFARLNEVQRSAEVIRYSILSTEYWLSPGGMLREWLRLNLAVALVLGIPALLLVPVATYLLTEFVNLTGLLVNIAKNLAVLPGALLIAIALFSALALIIRRLLAK